MAWCLNEQCASVLAKDSTDGYCPPCRKTITDGYRSGLLRAARRASAMAGAARRACECELGDYPDAYCIHEAQWNALTTLAAKLREEAEQHGCAASLG